MKEMEQICKTFFMAFGASLIIWVIIGMASALLNGFNPTVIIFLKKEMTPIVRLLAGGAFFTGIMWGIVVLIKFFKKISPNP
jgi:hypothetical protein